MIGHWKGRPVVAWRLVCQRVKITHSQRSSSQRSLSYCLAVLSSAQQRPAYVSHELHHSASGGVYSLKSYSTVSGLLDEPESKELSAKLRKFFIGKLGLSEVLSAEKLSIKDQVNEWLSLINAKSFDNPSVSSMIKLEAVDYARIADIIGHVSWDQLKQSIQFFKEINLSNANSIMPSEILCLYVAMLECAASHIAKDTSIQAKEVYMLFDDLIELGVPQNESMKSLLLDVSSRALVKDSSLNEEWIRLFLENLILLGFTWKDFAPTYRTDLLQRLVESVSNKEITQESARKLNQASSKILKGLNLLKFVSSNDVDTKAVLAISNIVLATASTMMTIPHRVKEAQNSVRIHVNDLAGLSLRSNRMEEAYLNALKDAVHAASVSIGAEEAIEVIASFCRMRTTAPALTKLEGDIKNLPDWRYGLALQELKNAHARWWYLSVSLQQEILSSLVTRCQMHRELSEKSKSRNTKKPNNKESRSPSWRLYAVMDSLKGLGVLWWRDLLPSVQEELCASIVASFSKMDNHQFLITIEALSLMEAEKVGLERFGVWAQLEAYLVAHLSSFPEWQQMKILRHMAFLGERWSTLNEVLKSQYVGFLNSDTYNTYPPPKLSRKFAHMLFSMGCFEARWDIDIEPAYRERILDLLQNPHLFDHSQAVDSKGNSIPLGKQSKSSARYAVDMANAMYGLAAMNIRWASSSSNKPLLAFPPPAFYHGLLSHYNSMTGNESSQVLASLTRMPFSIYQLPEDYLNTLAHVANRLLVHPRVEHQYQWMHCFTLLAFDCFTSKDVDVANSSPAMQMFFQCMEDIVAHFPARELKCLNARNYSQYSIFQSTWKYLWAPHIEQHYPMFMAKLKDLARSKGYLNEEQLFLPVHSTFESRPARSNMWQKELQGEFEKQLVSQNLMSWQGRPIEIRRKEHLLAYDIFSVDYVFGVSEVGPEYTSSSDPESVTSTHLQGIRPIAFVEVEIATKAVYENGIQIRESLFFCKVRSDKLKEQLYKAKYPSIPYIYYVVEGETSLPDIAYGVIKAVFGETP
jgi:hypothetical protein